MNKKFSYKIQDNILFLFVEGDYSSEEFLDFLKTALNDSRIPRRFGIVVDAQHAEVGHRINDIRPIQDELNNWKKRIARMAIVVDSNMHYGFTRQASVYDEFEGRDVSPFRDIGSAINWVKEKLE